ncbi:unnamed protein product [Acanthosepion pharaonis]|uniref:DUF7041 domain-containing protein n=1 Tax=Acanthosepion pharaonis TaxID=158019 RepID=A0A812D1S9_ACAPH|nr:unnamed protein product [Sepia pharaonis]
MPVFNSNVQTWFLQLDAIFQARHITSQQSKFAAVVEKLPAEVAAEVADILLTSLPIEKPYETLKQAILHRSGFSEERKIRNLLNVTIGDARPSQLLRRMQQLLGDNDISTTVFRQMWLDKLSADIVRILAALADDMDIQKLATIADKVADTTPIRHISATETVDGLVPDVNRQIQKLSSELQEISIQLRDLQKSHTSRRDNSTKHNKRLGININNDEIVINTQIVGTRTLARARRNVDNLVHIGSHSRVIKRETDTLAPSRDVGCQTFKD